MFWLSPWRLSVPRLSPRLPVQTFFDQYRVMYDEAIDVTDAEEVESQSPKSPDLRLNSPMDREEEVEHPTRKGRPQSAKGRTHSKMLHVLPDMADKRMLDSYMSDNSEEDEEDDDDDDVQAVLIEGVYDPREYEHMQVSSDVKALFEYITNYTPQNIQLDYKLQPFVPEYIPAVGDIDGFLKVARPDGVDDQLGLAVLDEPCAEQSEPAVLHLQLRAATKQPSAKPVMVKKVEAADRNPKAIERWIRDIFELHKTKPAPTVHYSGPMPDIDALMQEWPPDFERKLNETGLPLDELDTDLLTYVDLVCALFDIPVYESRIESLHVLFTLYSAIKNYKKGENLNQSNQESELG